MRSQVPKSIKVLLLMGIQKIPNHLDMEKVQRPDGCGGENLIRLMIH
jgi:hypothetical protein